MIHELYNLIIAQTIANEYFEFTKDYIYKQFDVYLDTKYKEIFTTNNRKDKRKLERLKKEEKERFNTQFSKYEKNTNKMVSHMDSVMTEDIEEITTEVSEFIEKLVKRKINK